MSREELETAIKVALDLNLNMVEVASIECRFGGVSEADFLKVLKKVIAERRKLI